MQLVSTVAEWRKLRATYRQGGRRVGFVPTMGALHAGHRSLIEAARRDCDVVVVSIFVNPMQFDETQDFESYPRPHDADQQLLAAAGVDVVFVPKVSEMYPNGRNFTVQEDALSSELCGAHRPGHFTGVLTVVLKLLQIAAADRAYFGEKDYQQLQLVRGMVAAFFIETRIVGRPPVREPDGLALSSRNTRLSPAERELAAQFSAILQTAPNTDKAQQQLSAKGFAVDYIEDRAERRLGAVRLGATRLIDNVTR